MSGINKVIIIGNLGQDPETKYTAQQNAVTNFSVATSEKWKDKSGQPQEHTEWHRVVVWGKQAENAGQYLKQGSKVYVEGKLQTRTWEDQEGNKRYTTEIVARDIQYLDSRQSEEKPAQPANKPAPAQPVPAQPDMDSFDDDIPF